MLPGTPLSTEDSHLRLLPHPVMMGTFLLLTLGGPVPTAGQDSLPAGAGLAEAGGAIRLAKDLPRILVFLSEDGEDPLAARVFGAFLEERGFPLIDPALPRTLAREELVRRALEGDDQAATSLGRDFGAQVLILGRATGLTRPDPVDGTLVTASGEISVRAVRLDVGRTVSSGTGRARALDATESVARDQVVRQAAEEILLDGAFLDGLLEDWAGEPWTSASYWPPDPGSVAAAEEGRGGRGPGLAILLAEVLPSPHAAHRGAGVVTRVDPGVPIFNPMRLEGVVLGEARSVAVEGSPAKLEPLDQDEARRLGLESRTAMRFRVETNLPLSRDTVRIVAQGPSGAVSETVVTPRIRDRWALIVGISNYASPEIPLREGAALDARGVRDFILSSAAGPFQEDHALFLENEGASREALREALFRFLGQVGRDDLLLVYLAGHGARDPAHPENLHLLPQDARMDALAATGLPLWDLKTALRRHVAAERVLLIADVSQPRALGQPSEPGDPLVEALSGIFTPSRRLTITAAGPGEASAAGSGWGGHGVFTYHLLEGLSGAGDMDGNGIVTSTELFHYVRERVRSATGGSQNPGKTGLGDIPLAVIQSSFTP